MVNSSAIFGLQFIGYCGEATVEDMVLPTNKDGNMLPGKTKKIRKAKLPPLEEVRDGFEQFYGDISSKLTEGEISRMGWDKLVAEHTLCKIFRLQKFWDRL